MSSAIMVAKPVWYAPAVTLMKTHSPQGLPDLDSDEGDGQTRISVTFSLYDFVTLHEQLTQLAAFCKKYDLSFSVTPGKANRVYVEFASLE